MSIKPSASRGNGQSLVAYIYLKQQGYDEFEQKVYRRLGNDTETTYTYDVVMRRLEALSSDSQERRNKFQHNRYAYDLVGNILSVENAVNLPPSAIGTLGGSSRYDYEYDELNRLIRAKGHYEGIGSRANYTLNMSYNSLNSIMKKELTHQINGVDKGYTLNYEYNNKKHPHAPSSIAEIGKPKARSYEYDGNGNPVYYDEFKSFRSMLWDEENRLRGINDNGRLHLYTYDHTGERALKSSAESSMAVINGASVASITHTDDYTAYVSPYFVVNKGKFTKHFFEGSSRIVSKLGEGTFVHKNTGITAGGVDYLALSAKMQQARDEYIKRLSLPPGPPTQHGIYASPEWTGEPYPSIDWQEISQNQEPPNGWPRPPRFNDPDDVPGPPVQFGDPITNANVKAGYGFVPNGVEEKNLYYYHPDHLGSSSYITDKEGKIIQHTEYMAFGEVLFDEHIVSPKQPYLFNGKELDYETGLYYYGARYYDAKTSIFLNVDPLVEKTGTPYAYTYNNPINLIDPTGEIPILPLLLKAGASGAADMLAQATMEYMFNPNVSNWEKAFDNVNWWQVGRSSLEGSVPWKTPGGRIGKAAITASGDVLVNAIHKSNYSMEQAGQDFAVGFIEDLAGGGIGDLISKYGVKSIANGLLKIGIDTKRIRQLTGGLDNASVRQWYSDNVKNINTNLIPTEANAKKIVNQRNSLKQQARDLMSDRATAKELDNTNPIRSYKYYYDKYYKEGYRGTELYRRIMQGGTTPNQNVNKKLGIE